MGIRKPRRDPRETAGAFEAFSFPTLIDCIFGYAPYESLLVLRAVCKDWRYRADCLIVRHVVVKWIPPFLTTWTAATPFGPIPHRNWHNTKIKDHVAQVDLIGDIFPAWLYRAPCIEAMRFGGKGLGVWSQKVITTVYPHSSSRYLDPAGRPNRGHIVIVIGPTTILCDSSSYYHSPLNPDSLTIIALNFLSGPRSGETETLGFMSWTAASFECLLESLATHLSSQDPTPVTVVNQTTWNFTVCYNPSQGYHHRLTANRPTRPTTDGENGPCRFADVIQDRVRLYLAELDVPEARQCELLAKVSFISLDQYRAKVGDDRVQFETGLHFT